jgi:histidinol-phosphate aminotransferase
MPHTSSRYTTDSVFSIEAPQPLPRIQTLAPYQQGKSTIPGRDTVIKLSSNESCFGPSPRAIEAYHAAAASVHRYPDGTQAQLRQAIARVHDIDPDRIVCGNGSEELIGLLIRCYLGENEELLLTQNHFVMCSIYGKGQGAQVVQAPEKEFTVDVDALLERITPETRVISVANPNNPTGTYVPGTDISRLVAEVPKNVLLILDGAYAEYVDRDDFDDGLHWGDSTSNVVITRTFSKIYGLAGLRIGWAYAAAPIIEVVNRLRTPFNANGPALAAAAAAVTDQAHVAMSREHTARWQERIRQSLAILGLTVVPSVTNFYLLDFSTVAGKNAVEASAFLESDGIIPRPGSSDRFVRITVGTDVENEAVLDSLTRYLSS